MTFTLPLSNILATQQNKNREQRKPKPTETQQVFMTYMFRGPILPGIQTHQFGGLSPVS